MPSNTGTRTLFPIWFLLLTLGLCRAGASQDKVILQSGEFYLGTIVEERSDWIVIRLQGGRSEVGMPRSQVQEILRGERQGEQPPEADHEPLVTASIQDRNAWFAVHDLEGRLVGCCHRVIRSESKDDSPLVRIEEQWVFGLEKERLHVHCLEYAHADLQPQSFQFREWQELEGTAVEGTVKGSVLVIQETNRQGVRTRRELPFVPGSSFPMIAALTLRREFPNEKQERELPVFDYRRGSFVEQRYEVGDRRPTKPGVDARIVTSWRGITPSEEWIDGAGETVRLEVNGPYLVATPARGTDMQSWIAGELRHSLGIPGFVGGGGRFRVHAPNPTWRAAETSNEDPGSVILRREDEDANVAVFEVSLDPDLTPEGAMLAFEKRLLELDAYERRALPKPFQRGPKRGTRLDFSYRDDRGVKRDGRVHLLASPDDHLVVVVSAPAGALIALERDLDRMLQLLQID